MSSVVYIFNPGLPVNMFDIPNIFPGFTLPSLRIVAITDFVYEVDDLQSKSGRRQEIQSAQVKANEIISVYGHRGITLLTPLNGLSVDDAMKVEKAIFPTVPKTLPEAKKYIMASPGKIKDLPEDLSKAATDCLPLLREAISRSEENLDLVRAGIVADYESKHRNTSLYGAEAYLYDFAGLKRPSRAEKIDDVPLEERIAAAVTRALIEAGVMKGGKLA